MLGKGEGERGAHPGGGNLWIARGLTVWTALVVLGKVNAVHGISPPPTEEKPVENLRLFHSTQYGEGV